MIQFLQRYYVFLLLVLLLVDLLLKKSRHCLEIQSQSQEDFFLKDFQKLFDYGKQYFIRFLNEMIPEECCSSKSHY